MLSNSPYCLQFGIWRQVMKLTISTDKLRDTSEIVRTFNKKKRTNNKNYSKNKSRRKYHGSF